jgi:enoyl-CoA hydratase/3-hydroxyacyl-CoA dehydrogenase
MNSISPQVVTDLRAVWEHLKGSSAPVRALVIASSNPFLFCAGADIKAFTSMDETSGAELIGGAHELFSELGSDGIATIAAVNPEIKLGIIPGFGGTQRLGRLVGMSKALEMNLVGDPILAEEAFELGLINRVVDDHELLDTALQWARKLAAQAPLAVAAIKRVSVDASLAPGLEAEKQAFAEVFLSADAKEGIAAFLGKRAAQFQGR